MNKKQFAQRLEPMKARLYRTAYLYLGNEANALEAVDEAIYRALKGLRQLREDNYFETWLTRILINQCKQEINRLGRIQPQSVLPEMIDESQDYDVLPLKEAISQLSEELKVVIILRYFSDYTLAQTAEALEIPQGTVVTRQRRALQLLKLSLLDEEEA